MSKETDSLPIHISNSLPTMVRTKLEKLDPKQQESFIEEYDRKTKSVGVGYIARLLLGLHYGYQGKRGIQIVYWITGGGFLIWSVIDLFRIPNMIVQYNKDIAITVMKDLQYMS